MKRKRLTQVFPFLLPIRKWQREKLFYLEMLIDGNKYAKINLRHYCLIRYLKLHHL